MKRSMPRTSTPPVRFCAACFLRLASLSMKSPLMRLRIETHCRYSMNRPERTFQTWMRSRMRAIKNRRLPSLFLPRCRIAHPMTLSAATA